MKTCSKCGIPKEETEFYTRSETGKLRNKCKRCHGITASQWAASHLEKKRGYGRAHAARKRLENPEKSRQYQRDQKAKNPDAVKRRAIKRRYGMSLEEWNRFFESQGGVCAICKVAGKKLCVDHDHKTGKVRGLLCKLCNVGIGSLLDSPASARAAAEYLEKNS